MTKMESSQFHSLEILGDCGSEVRRCGRWQENITLKMLKNMAKFAFVCDSDFFCTEDFWSQVLWNPSRGAMADMKASGTREVQSWSKSSDNPWKCQTRGATKGRCFFCGRYGTGFAGFLKLVQPALVHKSCRFAKAHRFAGCWWVRLINTQTLPPAQFCLLQQYLMTRIRALRKRFCVLSLRSPCPKFG